MNILHIIGNGFDLSLGLKTSYKHFYDYYSGIESSKDSINKLKKNISSNYNNWADLELALGQYTSEINSVNEFDEVFEDIGGQLAEYLKNQEELFDISKVNRDMFYENLVKPESFLSVIDSNKIAEYKNKYLKQNWQVDIFTFNYTSIIDKIVGNSGKVKIGNHPRNDATVFLRKIEHIHGYTNDRMVLGVNDVSQLKNKEFHNNIDILEAIVKSKCNEAYGHSIDNQFKEKLSQANLICIFGSSIGDTDNIWWEQIGNRIRVDNIPILIFTKGEEVISPRIAYKNNRTKRRMLDYFLRKIKLEKDEIEAISPNIFIALDTPMFKEILNK
ncbi:MAG: bacteriophage abortive infection AbiH family protein [Ferruginibacter sp.]